MDSLAWKTEDRPSIIAVEGVPAELTFVWDPVTDRLLSIFKAGSSASPTDPSGNLLRQFIHGDLGLDDPIEITTPDLVSVIPPGGSAPVTHVYPVYDEAGNGALQVVVNRNGEVVSRNVSTDPYGGEEFELAGAAVDLVEVKAKKNAAGALESVNVSVRATEALLEATIANGGRLAAVKPNGTPVALSPVSALPVPGDPFRLEWKLTAAQWTTLVDGGAAAGATSLSVATTDQLRAGAWAIDVPVLPAPTWATATLPVFSSSTLPVEVRESLVSLSSFVATIPPNGEVVKTPYEVTGLGTLGTSGGNGEFDLLMAANFHAQPFSDPFSGKNFVRARWYDPDTGTWLTPDPLGYNDSSNLYAFAQGDPINRRDPTGTVATLDKNGTLTVKHTDGRIETFTAKQAKENPRNVQKALDSDYKDTSYSRVEEIMNQMGLPIAYDAFECPPGEYCLSNPNAFHYTHDPHSAGFWSGCGEGIFIQLAGMPASTREQKVCGGAVQITEAVASTVLVVKGGMKVNAGLTSIEPVVPLRGGTLPVRVADEMEIKYPESPNSAARKGVQGSFVDPLTNQVTYTKDTLAADHVIPQSFIKTMPGFSSLTEEQQNDILNDPLNMQGLPQSYNSSKKDLLPQEWLTYKGKPLDPDYVARNIMLQDLLLRYIRSRISQFNKGE
jgi:RHS repeat-associated protein